jgi:hypothetical protein
VEEHLFEHNDSDEEIERAQAIAEDLGVDSLLFVITNSKWRSRRFTVDNSARLPIRSLAATVSPAAAMAAIAIECASFGARSDDAPCLGYVDRCFVSVGKFLTVEGWALERRGRYPEAVELVIDGEIVAKSRVNVRRSDVVKAYPQAVGSNCGFLFRVPIDPRLLPRRVEVKARCTSGTATFGGEANWTEPSLPVKRRADLPFATGPIGYAKRQPCIDARICGSLPAVQMA